MNHNCTEVLPSLLNKTKTSTMRKAWKKDLSNPWADEDLIEVNYRTKTVPFKEDNKKPPKYKVGDKVRMAWTGEQKEVLKYWDIPIPHHSAKTGRIEFDREGNITKVILGTVEILEVQEIEIGKETVRPQDDEPFEFCYASINDEEINTIELAKSEGFKNPEEMFDWFDKKYNLDAPKRFWRYVFKWLKN